MKSSLVVLFALGSLASTGSAQTPASTQVIIPCTQPAPVGSILPRQVMPLTFTDPNDEIVMEMEFQQPIGDWVQENSISGFGGQGYFRWDGPNFYGTPNVDTLTFRFKINTPGTYVIRMHVRHDNPDWTEGNDAWVRLDGGIWEKVYNNTGPGSVGVWSFDALYDGTNVLPQHVLGAGVHTWEVSGRSTDFIIDRIHVVPIAIFNANLNDPQSDFVRSRPVIGERMFVEIGDPRGTSGMVPGASLTAWYAGAIGAGYPCGTTTPFGELLINGPGGAFRVGPFKLWSGPQSPNTHRVDVPLDPSLVGLSAITQAVMVQPGQILYCEGLELTIGDV